MSQPGIYTNNQALPQQNLPVLNGSPPVTVINGPGYPYGSIPNTNHNNFGSRVIGGSRINGNVITNSYGPPGVRVVNGGSIGSNIYPHGQSIISHQSSIRKQPVQVFHAAGPPVPPMPPSTPGPLIHTNPSPNLNSMIETVRSTKYVDGGTVYQSQFRDHTDPERQTLNDLYSSKGYNGKKKSSPCCLALLGLLALAALLTGLFFIMRAINSGHSSVQKPDDINFIDNGTIYNGNNSTVNGSIGPAVIDSSTNPSTIKTNTTNTTITVPITNTTVTSNSSNTSLLQSDPNAFTIDKYLRSQDSYRLGNNPVLKDIQLKNENGKNVYYYRYLTQSGKEYIYGTTIANGSPGVQSVNVVQARHRHQLKAWRQE